jgi:hypothetical protein
MSVAYVVLAYRVLPAMWRHYEHHHQLEGAPKTTTTVDGVPGDPLNVGLAGSEAELVHGMLHGGWHPADPITLRTSLRIAESVVLHRDYETAPVSNLYLFGRRQDLAFERLVDRSPSRRHHVRFWKAPELARDQQPFWIGAATFDQSVGISHLTGQITHHIGPDVDADRDALIDGLRRGGKLVEVYQVTGVGATVWGRNGGGDWYYTDGEVTIGVLAEAEEVRTQPPKELPNPVTVQWKNRLWGRLRSWLH